MPVIVGNLINKFGLSSTLLLQAGIMLQALIGASLFRKPKYVQNEQSNVKYALLQVSNTQLQLKDYFYHLLCTYNIFVHSYIHIKSVVYSSQGTHIGEPHFSNLLADGSTTG